MGADLYINSLYEPNRGEWEEKFDAAVVLRDSLPEGSDEYAQAQHEVEHCHAEMYARGYFRDSYNDWNLLWKFGLSWWQDVIPMLDGQDRLSVAAAQRLLKLIEEREGIFEEKLGEVGREDRQHFRSAYARLTEFLKQAIALGEPIECSL